jgi:hypothetical protein
MHTHTSERKEQETHPPVLGHKLLERVLALLGLMQLGEELVVRAENGRALRTDRHCSPAHTAQGRYRRAGEAVCGVK